MTGRALLLVLDGVGMGGAPDAALYGDAGADTLGHVIGATGVALPHLAALGLHRLMGIPDAEGMRRIAEGWARAHGGLVFANLVDFDTVFGHRRDVAGFAAALAAFDAWLGGFLAQVAAEDLVILTADHGCDPTHAGTDHTREDVPLLVLHHGRACPLGIRDGFADVAASLALHFGVPPWPTGRPFLP